MDDLLLDQLEIIFRSRGLPSAHARVFGALLFSKKPLTQKEIAKKTDYSIPAISLALDELCKLGLVNKKKIKGKREKVYSVSGNLVLMFRNFIKNLREEQVLPFLRLLNEYPETPGLSKLKTEVERLNKYLEKLLEVKA